MRTKIAAGNWKMNTTPSQGAALLNELIDRTSLPEQAQTIIFAPFTHLERLQTVVKQQKASIIIGAQNCAGKEQGAYTGEVSLEMLQDLGITTVLIGHSERRALFGESSAILKQKVDLAVEKGFSIVFCVGEDLSERENENHFTVVQQQLVESLLHLSAEQIKQVIIAYEPVWAIGTGKTASPEQAQEMHAYIRHQVQLKYGTEVAQYLRILYGGSVKAENVVALFQQPDIDGGLVGGASLTATEFVHIMKAVQ